MNQCVIVYNNSFLTKNLTYLFVCAHIWLCMTCIWITGILFMNFCLCAYLYISLCIEVILSLFMSYVSHVSCHGSYESNLSWLWTLIKYLDCHYQNNWFMLYCFILSISLYFFSFYSLFYYYFFCFCLFSPQIIVYIYSFVHVLEKWRYRWKQRIGIFPGCASINRHRDIGVYEICRNRTKKTRRWW